MAQWTFTKMSPFYICHSPFFIRSTRYSVELQRLLVVVIVVSSCTMDISTRNSFTKVDFIHVLIVSCTSYEQFTVAYADEQA
jgi:hypothetical protein